FRKDLVHFLGAVEKNSRGRYRIVYNIAKQETNDYLVHVNIDSDQSGRLYMPLLVKDTIRDLIANARKYTPPGGKIDIGLTIHEGILRFVIEDNGRGIPRDEIGHVVKYGYRASNVIDEVKTMGNGLGLTKAHYVINRFGGRLWIDSADYGGTTIRFELPVQYRSVVNTEKVQNPELKSSEHQPGVSRKQAQL
ncbi:MAG: ATP-binding protein, partial [Balneolaceae bacterium]